MVKETDRGIIFNRRTFIVGTIQAGLMATLGGRLAWLQVVQGNKYKTLAENNRINIKMLPPSRGLIVDRLGVPIAINAQNFRVLVVPEQAPNLEASLSRLQKLVTVSPAEIQKVLKQIGKMPAYTPLEIRDNLGWEDVAKIEVNLPDLPGIYIDEGEIRHYPLFDMAAHAIGYVGAVSKSELTGDPVLTLPGFKIGKAGIEKSSDLLLRGTAGTAEVEVNVVGREVRELSNNPGHAGKKVNLTIDAELQKYVQERLSTEQSASAVVMDVNTGEIYAIASYPSFDPNIFTRGIPAEKWEELLSNPALPLTNKAVAGQYPPGSTFKMITALAALEAGVITRGNTVFCPGHFDYGDSRFHCWKHGGHGTMNVVDALAQSCDTFFYKTSLELGIDKIMACARKFGMGAKLDIGLPEERPGLIPSREWKRGQFNEAWQQGETIVASIGQGYTLTTPLQLAVMTARLVNGGVDITPRLIGTLDGIAPPAKPLSSLGFSAKNLEIVLKGMANVVNAPGGTALGSRISEPGFAMGGKTGTAQVKRITKEERAAGVNNADLAWRYRHHALFVGYAPLDKPRYACCVVVEHGGGGSAVAAPIARDILYMTQNRKPEKIALSTAGAEPVQPKGVQ